jgi:hypothetical protein
MVTGTTMLVAIAYMYFNRSKARPPQAAHLAPATEDRLERIERAVDSIAIEVERISEAQRFTARLLAEGRRPDALAAADSPEGRRRE